MAFLEEWHIWRWTIFRSFITPSNGDIFRVTGPLWGESIGHRWIPLIKVSAWTNNRYADDLRHHSTYYDVTAIVRRSFLMWRRKRSCINKYHRNGWKLLIKIEPLTHKTITALSINLWRWKRTLITERLRIWKVRCNYEWELERQHFAADPVMLPVIWNTMVLMWHHCNEDFFRTVLDKGWFFTSWD